MQSLKAKFDASPGLELADKPRRGRKAKAEEDSGDVAEVVEG